MPETISETLSTLGIEASDGELVVEPQSLSIPTIPTVFDESAPSAPPAVIPSPDKSTKGELDAYGNKISPENLARLEQINHKFSLVISGGKSAFGRLSPSVMLPDCKEFVFIKKEAFEMILATEPDINFNGRIMTLSQAWMKWRGRRFYKNGIGFFPNKSQCPKGMLNLFTGYSVQPEEGDISPFLELVEAICDGEPDAKVYLLNWLAHLFQKPEEKPTVAILLKSEIEGVGKGSLFRPLLKILGSYAAQLNGQAQASARFNAILEAKLLVFSDEVDLSEKSAANALKAVITEPYMTLERKGVDAFPIRNYSRMVFAGNEDHAVHLSGTGRRYLVFDVQKVLGEGFFTQYNQWLDNGGEKALLHYFLNRDISAFNPFFAPATKAAIDQKLQSMTSDPLQSFFYNEIAKEHPFTVAGSAVNSKRLLSKNLVERYMEWVNSQSRYKPISLAAARSQVGKMMKSLGVVSQGRHGRGEGVIYQLPEPEVLRNNFAEKYQAEADELMF
ncbi:DUF5906 domain-containing protein [Aestuariirhabdus sp. Z084]|uniref:DUF5906 domain-containing protein n=1 Tax=Aestuariirhabdus haliotis TaxID=2918751 RepID=UPI00201B4544|nr:DUF5906 domain-containing protein [Aestuariirhabdus haliotis]MCL6416348.1 DUF5906 domain-containing protein [Aestuariirhabdus haliotis]MCL6420337.1 DUF5906 domain-containing protein [Aestuariirhabdus haliotis]